MLRRIETVTGTIDAGAIGKTLVHEHILVDWIGADKITPGRYDPVEVVATMSPYLREIIDRGYKTLFECTPAYISRDPELLRTLSDRLGLNIITNTGYYKEPYIPASAFGATAEEIADIWICEWRDGIGETGIRPGFIKIAVNGAPLPPMQRKIVKAAGITSLATGLTIASHTGSGDAALEQIEILKGLGLSPDRFIVVHLDGVPERDIHLKVYDSGAWLEYDCIGWKPVEQHVELLEWAKERHLLDKILISHDMGWYTVGKPGGGKISPYTHIHDTLTPALQKRGIVTSADIDGLLTENPPRAFGV